jgi:hypothetical protein
VAAATSQKIAFFNAVSDQFKQHFWGMILIYCIHIIDLPFLLPLIFIEKYVSRFFVLDNKLFSVVIKE